MGKLVKIVSIFLAVVLFSVVSPGCDNNSGPQVNPNATQLYIGNYEGGIGEEWLKVLAREFEKKYEDVEFEDGKTGLQIWIRNEKDLFGDNNLFDRIDTNQEDIYFLHGITYGRYVANNKLLDITSAVKGDLSEFDEDKTIEERLSPKFKEMYETNGKYYALPFYDALFGVVYDVDLFEKDNLYFSNTRAGDGGPKFVTSKSETRSAGPDGKLGSGDDGLPAVYSEFVKLLSEIRKYGHIPFCWTGEYTLYRQRFLTGIWADYEGKDNFELNGTLSGNYSGKYVTDGVESVLIKNSNGNLLQKQKGKEYALQMAYEIVKNTNNYSSASFDNSQSHLLAQDEFLVSKYSGRDRIAMLIDGGWWENEARGMFEEMADIDPDDGYGQRRFGLLPIPKSDDGLSNPRRTVLAATGTSVACISAKTTKADLAKLFLQYCHTEHGLSTFTKITGVPRAFDYDLTTAQMNEMTHYSKDVWNTYRSDDTDVVYNNLLPNGMISDNFSYFSGWFWDSYISGKKYSEPMLTFRNNAAITATSYFNGLFNNYSDWDNKLSAYF